MMMDVAADELEVNADDLETDGKGEIHVKGAPPRSISVFDVALAAHFKHGKTVSGRGMFMPTRSYPDPETGKMVPATCYAHACTVAEVEVDTETGEVDVLSLKSAYEVGHAPQPQDGRAADRRRRLDGHEPRALRDHRALLPRPRPRPGRLQRIPDAGARRPAGDGGRRSSSVRRPTGRTAPRASAR